MVGSRIAGRQFPAMEALREVRCQGCPPLHDRIRRNCKGMEHPASTQGTLDGSTMRFASQHRLHCSRSSLRECWDKCRGLRHHHFCSFVCTGSCPAEFPPFAKRDLARCFSPLLQKGTKVTDLDWEDTNNPRSFPQAHLTIKKSLV